MFNSGSYVTYFSEMNLDLPALVKGKLFLAIDEESEAQRGYI